MTGVRSLGLTIIRLLTAAGTLALAVMLFWTIADVGLRLAIGRPLYGTIDLVEATLVLVAFLALPECFRQDEQIKVDVFDRAAGPRGVAVMRLIGEVATLAFLVLLSVTVLTPLADAYRFGDAKADLPIPIFLLLLAIETALVASAVVVLVAIVAQLRRLSGPNGDLAPEQASEGPRA